MASDLTPEDRRALLEVGELPAHNVAERIGHALGLPLVLVEGKLRALAWRGLVEYRGGKVRVSNAGLAVLKE